MFGDRSRRKHQAAIATWTPNELIVLKNLQDLIEQTARNTPDIAGVWDVLFAPDRDAFLVAIERYPALLTDSGSSMFDFLTLIADLMGEPRVTDRIKRGKVAVQAVREARE